MYEGNFEYGVFKDNKIIGYVNGTINDVEKIMSRLMSKEPDSRFRVSKIFSIDDENMEILAKY